MLRVLISVQRGRDPDNPTDRKHPSNGRFRQRLEIGGEVSNTLTSVGKDNLLFFEYE